MEFEELAWARVQFLAADTNRTFSEVLKEALELEIWFTEARRTGGRVLIERNGKYEQLMGFGK